MIASSAWVEFANGLTIMADSNCRARHKPYCACIRSQVSAVLHPAFSSLIAISAELPVRPASNLESERGEIPKPTAAAVKVPQRPDAIFADDFTGFADDFTGMGGPMHLY